MMENTVKRVRDRKKQTYTTRTSSLRMWEEKMEQKQYWWDNYWKISNHRCKEYYEPNRINPMKTSPTHVKKCWNSKTRNPEGTQRKKMTHYQESNATDTDFNKNRWSQKKIGYIFFKGLKNNNWKPRILYPMKLENDYDLPK